MPVSASGESAARLSIASRTSSSQSSSSGANVTRPASSASAASNGPLVREQLRRPARGSPRNRVSSRVSPLLIVSGPPFIADSAIVFGRVGIVEHVGAIGGERQLEQRAGEAAARLDEREEAARRQVQALQRALHEVDDLAHQPVRPGARAASRSTASTASRIAFGLDDDRADQRLVHAQPQQRVVELAERAQRPELIAGRDDRRPASIGCGRLGRLRPSASATRLLAIDRRASTRRVRERVVGDRRRRAARA